MEVQEKGKVARRVAECPEVAKTNYSSFDVRKTGDIRIGLVGFPSVGEQCTEGGIAYASN